MASFSRSFKPPAYLSSMATHRPGMPGRSLSNMSNASEVSSAASSPGDFNADDIIYSAVPSPTLTTGPSPGPTKRVNEMRLNLPESPRSSSSRSHPIAIELPIARSNQTTGSVYTPPAPLSGRGDLPGGYFPLHEEQSRVYRNHPFHLDASKARQRSIRNATETTSPQSLPPVSSPVVTERAPPPLTVPLLAAMPERAPALPPTAATSSANTPVASYIPSGANPLPMGKYYPSNYENRMQQRDQQNSLRPSASGQPANAVKSETQVPTLRGDSSMATSRNASEAKRRLQQYQRDMIAQASLALNGGNVNAAALNAISLRNMGFSSLSSKPSKPKLVPLGSPGPITPMDLESSDDGYLGVRLSASEDHLHVEDVARAIRADEERRRREGTTSPAVEPAHMF